MGWDVVIVNVSGGAGTTATLPDGAVTSLAPRQ